jgi:23S rRNA (adenine2503-C2)-methyltransferase
MTEPTHPRYGATRDELSAVLDRLGEPKYRAHQVWSGLWEQRRPLERITTLSAPLRERLCEAFPLSLSLADERSGDNGMTRKWLWRGHDGAQVETVLMRYPQRATVCISSQAGCAMGCTFCATGQAGFERHLTSTEIVEQVLRAQHESEQRVANVVFMGMGEPLANVDAVLDAIERLHRDLGLSARHITVSTVGVVPGMRRLAHFALPVTLAVSLHAPFDDQRNELVPLNRRYPIDAVLEAARDYALRKGRRVTFEYACIAGRNDSLADAGALAELLRGFPAGAHVNLLPLNPTSEFGGRASRGARMEAFAARLEAGGVNATIRRNRGVDIDAACGQLRSRAAGSARGLGSATMEQ